MAERDEAAFEALVHRHGPMVLGLCRRVLHDHHDAEDSFQATFLLLARKAALVVKRESVGSWLYAVAYRTALEARSVLCRQRTRERQVDDMPHPEVAPQEVQDWRPLLDREIERLPEKYRAAVVLYHLEGRGHREVARQLGLPEGTLSSRLTKARRLLAARLSRQGLSLSAAALAVALSEGSTVAVVVPAPLVASTVEVAAGRSRTVGRGRDARGPFDPRSAEDHVPEETERTGDGAGGDGGPGGWRAGVPGGRSGPGQDRPDRGKPPSEVETLRKENELLRLNLQVVLEKVRAQEAELHALRGQVRDPKSQQLFAFKALRTIYAERLDLAKANEDGIAKKVEDALRLMRQARTPRNGSKRPRRWTRRCATQGPS